MSRWRFCRCGSYFFICMSQFQGSNLSCDSGTSLTKQNKINYVRVVTNDNLVFIQRFDCGYLALCLKFLIPILGFLIFNSRLWLGMSVSYKCRPLKVTWDSSSICVSLPMWEIYIEVPYRILSGGSWLWLCPSWPLLGE